VTAVYAGVPKHGASFRITKLDVDLSNGVEVKATSVKCSATVGGAHLAGTGAGGCTLHLPATAKGKALVVKVSGHYKAKTVSNTIHLTVK
jgi:galactokinase